MRGKLTIQLYATAGQLSRLNNEAAEYHSHADPAPVVHRIDTRSGEWLDELERGLEGIDRYDDVRVWVMEPSLLEHEGFSERDGRTLKDLVGNRVTIYVATADGMQLVV